MKIEYTTEIDTISLQLSFSSDNEQRVVLVNTLKYLHRWLNAYISLDNYYVGFDNRRVYKIYCNGRTIVSFVTGYSHGNFFIKIRFAGLKTYDAVADDMSYWYLICIVAYLNTNNIQWGLAELDVAIDMVDVDFNNILAVCTTKTSRTKYHGLGEQQIYHGETTYIEEFASASSKTTAMKRSYLYNKSLKEHSVHNNEIGFSVQRFEVKLQAPYFLKYDFSIDALQKTLNMYHLMYFKDISAKDNLINRYNNHKSTIRKREIERWGFEDYRLYFDMNYISDFISLLTCVNNDWFFGDDNYLIW